MMAKEYLSNVFLLCNDYVEKLSRKFNSRFSKLSNSKEEVIKKVFDYMETTDQEFGLYLFIFIYFLFFIFIYFLFIDFLFLFYFFLFLFIFIFYFYLFFIYLLLFFTNRKSFEKSFARYQTMG